MIGFLPAIVYWVAITFPLVYSAELIFMRLPVLVSRYIDGHGWSALNLRQMSSSLSLWVILPCSFLIL